MLENIVKRTKIFGGALLLAAAISCGESHVDKKDPIINSVSYISNSRENSLNYWFVTGEDINVYVGLDGVVDSVNIDAERRFRDSNVRETYEMVKGLGNNYSGVIPAFDDAGILSFKVIVNQGERVESSSIKEEVIFISENDAHDIVINFCNKRNEFWDYCNYNINEILDYGAVVLNADFNLKKVEGFILSNEAIIEYVGENDLYESSLDERDYLNSNNINNRYIYNLLYPDYPLSDWFNQLTNKQDLENYVSNFYYSLN